MKFVKLQHIFENSRNSNLPFFCHIGLFQPLIKFCQNCNNTVINSSQWRWEYEFWAGIYFGINLSTVWNRYFQSKLWIFSLKRRVSDVSQEPNSSVSICKKCLRFSAFLSYFQVISSAIFAVHWAFVSIVEHISPLAVFHQYIFPFISVFYQP